MMLPKNIKFQQTHANPHTFSPYIILPIMRILSTNAYIIIHPHIFSWRISAAYSLLRITPNWGQLTALGAVQQVQKLLGQAPPPFIPVFPTVP